MALLARFSPTRSRWLWLTAAVLLVLAFAVYHHESHPAGGQSQTGAARPSPVNGSGRGGGRGSDGRGGGAVPVVAAKATTGDMPVYLDELGTVTALRTVTVHTRVDGQLVSVNFKEGQLVHEGDLLAQIDPRPFQVQLTQAEGQLAKDQSALQNAQLDLERYQALFQQDAVPKQQLDTQMATVNQAKATITSDQGQVDAARLNLTYARVTSPLTGRIGLRLVDAGNIVHAADQTGLVVITQRQPITVVFTIPEDSLQTVLAHQTDKTPLAVDAYDRDIKTKLASGTLGSIDSAIDPTTGTIKLKATFANKDERLFPNQFVNARLFVDTYRGVVIVPSAAIQRGAQQTFVYVVKPDNTVESRTVDVRLTEADRTALKSGVKAGDMVVVDGVDKLEPGSQVTVRAPDANQGSTP
ncbi:MAG TPA: MdtA/MuxA family multidrug efflux RND transporter periplasmic adaptor subunit [Vicinamibacterales bacterium]|jgi:multidrug efflux system membrane fusion protein|nr:MdtA/MuxA family multidrug efflux RND transporter periplasmic adaptor subunit [Vicinamibacterales bacterium]